MRHAESTFMYTRCLLAVYLKLQGVNTFLRMCRLHCSHFMFHTVIHHYSKTVSWLQILPKIINIQILKQFKNSNQQDELNRDVMDKGEYVTAVRRKLARSSTYTCDKAVVKCRFSSSC